MKLGHVTYAPTDGRICAPRVKILPGLCLLPNLKSVALSVYEILRGPKISKLGHVTHATST